MTEKYRKLTEEELKRLATHLPARFVPSGTKVDRLSEQIKQHVQKYYPAGACSAIFTFQSEYNDEYYNCHGGYLVVYDRDGEEVAPMKSTADESRGKWSNFTMPSECVDHPEPKTVLIHAPKIPDLYIKE